jgi:hypothetical protein
MATAAFQLFEDFFPQDVVAWYHQAALRDMAVITLPHRLCRLRLIRGNQECVVWWPEGERSATVTLENAVERLTMLQSGHRDRSVAVF